jgi:hypothetical protein
MGSQKAPSFGAYPPLAVAAALFGIPSLLVCILANLVYDGYPSMAGRIAI